MNRMLLILALFLVVAKVGAREIGEDQKGECIYGTQAGRNTASTSVIDPSNPRPSENPTGTSR